MKKKLFLATQLITHTILDVVVLRRAKRQAERMMKSSSSSVRLQMSLTCPRVIPGWTFTLIGTDNLDVETMAQSFAIDEHLEFKQDEEGTKAMFARERRSRERYNCCLACESEIPKGSFFKED